MGARFDYIQATRIRDALTRRGVRYLFLGKSGAILLGYADMTQDVDLFVEKGFENAMCLTAALTDLRFELTPDQVREVHDGNRGLIQLRKGPFDLNLFYAPDGIPSFEAAWRQHVEVDGFHVCHLDHIIRSKVTADRLKDRESLPRLRAFRDYWLRERFDQRPDRLVQPDGSPQTVFWDALEQVREITERAVRLGVA